MPCVCADALLGVPSSSAPCQHQLDERGAAGEAEAENERHRGRGRRGDRGRGGG